MKENYKSGFVALIGRPNVGKSTLMNHLIGQKIAITSKKPQTTRNRIQTVYTSQEGQIVFLDTPGIHKAKNKLVDMGLLRRLAQLAPTAFGEGNRLFTEFKGALTENFVFQTLITQFEVTPRYWT